MNRDDRQKDRQKLEGETKILATFDRLTQLDNGLIGSLVDDADALLAEARDHMVAMLEKLAYVDDVRHPMASSLHFCAIMLSLYLALRSRGVDPHDFGNRLLSLLREQNEANPPPALSEPVPALAAAAEQPVKSGQFAFDVINGEADSYSMTVTSCAVCALFAQYDAMDLVPYMCASDDVMSDAGGQGLRRRGSIALGADHCDFVFVKGGDPLRLADQYPEKIKFVS